MILEIIALQLLRTLYRMRFLIRTFLFQTFKKQTRLKKNYGEVLYSVKTKGIPLLLSMKCPLEI